MEVRRGSFDNHDNDGGGELLFSINLIYRNSSNQTHKHNAIIHTSKRPYNSSWNIIIITIQERLLPISVHRKCHGSASLPPGLSPTPPPVYQPH